MEFWIGTTNKGKLSEIRLAVEKELPQLSLKTLNDLSSYTQPPEDGKSFLENARIKAKSLKAMRPGVWVMAEDSGLEVEGLGNLPGIHSARYAGPKASDSENNAKLLKMLQLRSPQNRKAKFVCTIVAYSPEGEEFCFEGQIQGQIAKSLQGQMGFGYDPLFIPEKEGKTMAELGPGFKAQNSHRALALKSLIQKLKESLV